MQEEKKVAVPETAEEVTLEVTPETEVSEEVETQESIEEIKERLAKAEELANNYKVRAEKAEKSSKLKPPQDVNSLSTKDFLAITNAKVPEEDIDEVVEYAKYRKTSVSEILKDPIMKATLDLRAEERNTALAANVSTTRRGSQRVPDDVLLDNASKGRMPESDVEINRLLKAKFEQAKKER